MGGHFVKEREVQRVGCKSSGTRVPQHYRQQVPKKAPNANTAAPATTTAMLGQTAFLPLSYALIADAAMAAAAAASLLNAAC